MLLAYHQTSQCIITIQTSKKQCKMNKTSMHPNMRHCLEIHVTLSEELGAVPPPCHSWMVPLVEDMLHDIRTGLTKAVVTVPGRAVLFYGRHSFGEGLTADEARDHACLLTGAGTWVGKPAYLTTDPMTIQEGQWTIAQAVMACQVKVRGPGHPCVNQPAQCPFWFDHPRGSPLRIPLGMVAPTITMSASKGLRLQ